MSAQQWECRIDRKGNVIVASGWAFQRSTGTLIEAWGSPEFEIPTVPEFQTTRSGIPTQGPRYGQFVGGSGRLLVATPSATLANTDAPTLILGFYTPSTTAYDGYASVATPGTTLIGDTINDGTNDVAIWSSGDTAPLGTFTATTYGEDTYNASGAFDITITEEVTGGTTPPSVEVTVSAGTAQGGTYSLATSYPYASDLMYLSDDDPDWMLVINTTTQTVQMIYLSDLIAESAEILTFDDPSGVLDSVTFGETTYNGGDPFTVTVWQQNARPRAGYIIAQCNLVAGTLDSISKPFYSATIPADTATEIYTPIFYSDGSTTAQQIHTGLLVIP